MANNFQVLKDGIAKNNPIFVQVIGTCPTLAVTTSAINGIGMGVSTMAVLICSNIFISILRKVIPDEIRIPCFIVVIASFVTIVEMVLKAFLPSLSASLGLYIPLIVVNCIILGRAEGFASKNGVVASAFDGVGNGIGFTIGLCMIGLVRELLGAGTLFGVSVLPAAFPNTLLFVMAPGALFTYGIIMAAFKYVVSGKLKKNA